MRPVSCRSKARMLSETVKYLHICIHEDSERHHLSESVSSDSAMAL